jgi:hypothetical protein
LNPASRKEAGTIESRVGVCEFVCEVLTDALSLVVEHALIRAQFGEDRGDGGEVTVLEHILASALVLVKRRVWG